MTTEGRLWLKLISAHALAQYMEFRGETNRSLAAKAGVGHAIVGHLRSGKRSTCSPTTAAAIERCLNAPPGSLFVPRVTIGSRAISRKVVA